MALKLNRGREACACCKWKKYVAKIAWRKICKFVNVKFMNKHGAHFIPAKVLSNSLVADIMIMHTEKLKYFAPESKSCNNKKKLLMMILRSCLCAFRFRFVLHLAAVVLIWNLHSLKSNFLNKYMLIYESHNKLLLLLEI